MPLALRGIWFKNLFPGKYLLNSGAHTPADQHGTPQKECPFFGGVSFWGRLWFGVSMLGSRSGAGAAACGEPRLQSTWTLPVSVPADPQT